MEHIKGAKAALVAFAGGLTAIFGWFGWLVILFVACMAVDYITGSVAAARGGEWNSGKARSGIWHKLGSLIAVAVAGGVDLLIGIVVNDIVAIQLPFDYSVLICPIVLVWYTVTELGSIIENVGALGAPVPGFLRKAIKVFRSTTEATGDRVAGDTEETEADK